MSREVWEQLRSWSWEPGTAAVLTDIDGVLAPIVPTPDISEVSRELRDLLRRLSERHRLVAGVGSRASSDALRLVGLEELVYYGNHGFEVLCSRGEVEIIPEAASYKEKIEELENKAREERSSNLLAPSSRRRALRPRSTTATSLPRSANAARSSSNMRVSGWG